MPKLPWKSALLGISLFFLIGFATNTGFRQANFIPANVLDSLKQNTPASFFPASSANTPSSATAVPERQLLPTNVKPLNYNLTLDPNFETFKFDGNVAIRYVLLFFFFHPPLY